MANKEHLAILKRGVEAWNTWREENPTILPNLSEADLSGADLTAAKALGSDFRGAILTGACIADWNTNEETILEDVFCKFVYRKFDFNKNQKAERCPYGRNFESGEFTKVFQKLQDTIKLTLNNGVNWAAFAYSFRELQVKHEDQPLKIKSIDNRDGVIVVEVKVPPGADKEKAEDDFYKNYQFRHKVLEGQYQAQLKSKDDQINQLFTIINQLINQQSLIQKALAENPRTVVNNNLPNSQWAGGFSGTTHGNQIGGEIYNDGQQQDFNPESSQ